MSNRIAIGKQVTFNPFESDTCSGASKIRTEVTGTIIWINRVHGWFLVEYGPGLRTSFPFWEVGKAVTIRG